MPPIPSNPWPLGKTAVVTAGTPLDLLTASGNAAKLSATTGAKIRVSSILFVVGNLITVNTGYVYIGVKGMNKGTGAGVITMIPLAAAGTVNTFLLTPAGWGGTNEISPEDVYIDGDTNGNSALATAFVY